MTGRSRSSVAAIIARPCLEVSLRHQGHGRIINVLGGMGAWNSANYEKKE